MWTVEEMEKDKRIITMKKEIEEAINAGFTRFKISDFGDRYPKMLAKGAVWLYLYEKYGYLSAYANEVYPGDAEGRTTKRVRNPYLTVVRENKTNICEVNQESLKHILKKTIEHIYDRNHNHIHRSLFSYYNIYDNPFAWDFDRILYNKMYPYEDVSIIGSAHYEMKVILGGMYTDETDVSFFIPLKKGSIKKITNNITDMWKYAVYDFMDFTNNTSNKHLIDADCLCTFLADADTGEQITDPIYTRIIGISEGTIKWLAPVISGVSTFDQIVLFKIKEAVEKCFENALETTITKSGTIFSIEVPERDEYIEFNLSETRRFKL